MNPAARNSPPLATPGEDADAREFEAFAQTQDPLELDAATWAARRRNGLDAQGEAELRGWLDADPRHAVALNELDALFGEIRQLPDDDVAALKASLPEHAQRIGVPPGERIAAERPLAAPPLTPSPAAAILPTASPPSPAGRPDTRPASPNHTSPNHANPSRARPDQPGAGRVDPGRRRWLVGLGQLFPQAMLAAAAFAVVGGSWFGWSHWRQLPVFEQTYATARGQQRTVNLPDAAGDAPDSTLQLDTATRLGVTLYRDRRDVTLHNGQALFSVHADPARPFHVVAGRVRISVVGTRFSVRHTPSGLDAGRTVIAVEEGRVRVARLDPGAAQDDSRESSANAAPVLLVAGQTVTAGADGQLSPVARVAPGASAAWRDGRVSFEATPLGDALAEFERYGHTGLVVHDPAVAALHVGGSYSLRHFARFVETLPQVLPVRLVRRGAVTEVVAR